MWPFSSSELESFSQEGMFPLFSLTLLLAPSKTKHHQERKVFLNFCLAECLGPQAASVENALRTGAQQCSGYGDWHQETGQEGLLALNFSSVTWG